MLKFKKALSVAALSMSLLISGGIIGNAKETVTVPDDLFKKSLQKGLLDLDSEGLLISNNKKVSKLSTSSKDYNDYKETVESLNFLVENDIVNIENDLSITMLSSEEISDLVFKKYQENPDEENPELLNAATTKTKINLLAVDNGLSSINLKSIVEKNRDELEKIYTSMLKTNPKGAYSGAVGYFVGKVRENGAWDYKVKSGYKPWYKEFNAATYDGKKVINSEYIGNYNYGYTGELLFSKKILLIGGATVGAGTRTPEDEKDRNTITKGFNDAVKYY